MKKMLMFFAIVGLIGFASCEGPEDPQGPQGYDGAKGEPGFVSGVFELLNVDFGENDKDGYNITGTIKPLLTNASTVLIYRLVGDN